MKTKIINLKKKQDFIKSNEFYYVIYFDYYGEERFTYLTKRSIMYWKSKGLNKLNVGLLINVSKVNDKHFKIIGFENVSF